MDKQQILNNFRTERYDFLNKLRWDLFLKMGIPISGKTVFEPGAGVGDQTDWLLKQGAKHIYVNDGRADNLEIIRQRFAGDPRLTFLLGNLENCLDKNCPDRPEFKTLSVDLVFLWGVYYHIHDSLDDFRIMKALAKIGQMVAFDYLESSKDGITFYGYDNPSTSLSQYAIRPTTPTMIKGLKSAWKYVYLPKTQMNWEDPLAAGTPRRLAVGSMIPIKSAGLILQ